MKRHRFSSWFVVLAYFSWLPAAGNAEEELPDNVVQVIDQQLVPAHTTGNTALVLQILSQLTNELSDTEIVSLERYLSTQDLPTAGELMAGARQRLIELGLVNVLPTANERELFLAIPVIDALVNETLQAVREHELVAQSLPHPDELKSYENMFNELDALDARLVTTHRFVQHTYHEIARNKRIARTIGHDKLAETLTELRKSADEVSKLHQQLLERALEMRLDRFLMATAQVTDAEDFMRRMTAARAVELDGEALVAFLDNANRKSRRSVAMQHPIVFTSKRLNEEDLGYSVRDDLEQIRSREKDLFRKSRLLFDGLEWWIRGRYGRGSEAQGLLRSALAVRTGDPRAGVSMPPAPYKPTDPLLDSEKSPDYERRHHYVWGYPSRRIRYGNDDETPYDYGRSRTTRTRATKSNYREEVIGQEPTAKYHQGPCGAPIFGVKETRRAEYDETTTATSRIVQRRRLVPNDYRAVERVVGYPEYSNALANLNQLDKIVSKDERSAIDEFVAGRDELAVYTNLSRRVQPGRSSLAEEPTELGDDYKRLGLAWVTSLARVEVGSMLAAFTSVRRPYEMVAPNNYDRDEFYELMLDGVRSHYWALQRDPAVWRLARSSPSNPSMLTYAQRMVMVSAMFEAVRDIGYGRLNPVQWKELKSWERDLDNLNGAIVGTLNKFMLGYQSTQTTTSTKHIVKEIERVRRIAVDREAPPANPRATPANRPGPTRSRTTDPSQDRRQIQHAGHVVADRHLRVN